MHVALILTGGPSKQLGLILGGRRSRSLARLPGRTLLQHITESLRGVVDGVYVAYDDPEVPRHCSGCTAVYAPVTGIGETLCYVEPRLGLRPDDRVTLVYGDVYGEPELYAGHVRASEQEGERLVTLVRPVIARGGYLRVRASEDGLVTEVGAGDLVFAGLATLEAGDLKLFCQGGVDRALAQLASRGRLIARLWPSVWVDVDTPWDYAVAVRYELSKLTGLHVDSEARVSDRAELEPPVVIERGARIDSYAVVRGPAYISSGSLVGAHAFVRHGTFVQEAAVVGAYSEVKRSVIGARARIGSHCYIVDSVVGDEALVAPYTVTLNTPVGSLPEEVKQLMTTTHPLEGVKVGAVIAANARTRPHTVIEPASIVT